MTQGASNLEVNQNQNQPPPAGTDAKPGEAKTEAKTEAKPGGEAKKDETKEAKKDLSAEKRRVQLADDDDEIPDDADILEMSKKALTKRLQRFNKSTLREHFGTDKLDEIQAKLKRGAELEEQAEKDRQAKLTEAERQKEELAKERQKREAAEAKLRETEERAEFREYTSTASSGLAEYIDPDYIDVEIDRFARVVGDLSEKELLKFQKNPSAFRAFAREWAKERVEAKPKLAKDYTPPAKDKDETKKDETKKEKILLKTGGGNEDKPPPAKLEKTPLPGRPNSMNANELREYKKANGIIR